LSIVPVGLIGVGDFQQAGEGGWRQSSGLSLQTNIDVDERRFMFMGNL
jgi:hypothetical protein